MLNPTTVFFINMPGPLLASTEPSYDLWKCNPTGQWPGKRYPFLWTDTPGSHSLMRGLYWAWAVFQALLGTFVHGGPEWNPGFCWVPGRDFLISRKGDPVSSLQISMINQWDENESLLGNFFDKGKAQEEIHSVLVLSENAIMWWPNALVVII